MKHIKSLDTLRAFAVIFVLLGHWPLPIDFGATGRGVFSGIIPSPKFGVNLFFVLSGFLITGILLDARTTGESKLRIMRSFIARRTLRIFPIYYLSILVLVLVGFPFIKEHLVWFLTYTSNVLISREQKWNVWFHTWSLSVEEQFYLFWPWLILYVKPKYLPYVFYLSLLIGVGTTIWIRAEPIPNYFALHLTPACMQAFGIGGFYAYVRRREGGVKSFMRGIYFVLPVALLFHFYWGFSADGGHFNYWERTADSVLSIWLIHFAINIRAGWLKKKVMENSLLIKIGRISYGVYLYHFAIPRLYGMAMDRLGVTASSSMGFLLNPFISYGIQLVFLFALSAASFAYIEAPLLKLKRFFEYKKGGDAPAAGEGSPEAVVGEVA